MANVALIDGQVLPNVYRVVSFDSKKIEFPKAFPNMLQGLMTEQAYVSYLTRIEEAAQVSQGAFLLMIIPFLLYALGFVLDAMDSDASSILFIVSGVAFFLTIIIVLFLFVRAKKNSEEATAKVIEGINERLRSRGVRWSFERQKNGRRCYIDITITGSAGQQQQQQQQYTVVADPWASMATAPASTTSAMPAPTAPPSDAYYSPSGTAVLYSSPYSTAEQYPGLAQTSYSYEAPSYSSSQPLVNYSSSDK